MPRKILIIRFSSFGDIAQCLAIVKPLKKKFPDSQIFWVTKTEFESLIYLHKDINRVFALDKKSGFLGLLKLAFSLRKEKFDLIYDAHNNLRSFVLRFFTWPVFNITRPKNRLKRLLLFWLRIDLFPMPFRGIMSFLEPLKPFKIDLTFTPLKIMPSPFQFFKKYMVIAPSAAWELKRWPLDYWSKLINLLPDKNIIILGGSSDFFCKDLEKIDPGRCLSLAGKLSYLESSQVVSNADIVISGDTGIIHIADLLGVKGILLMGPSAFGYTTGDHIKILERPLYCRPCTKDGRGRCKNPAYKKCLVDLLPSDVAYLVNSLATSKS